MGKIYYEKYLEAKHLSGGEVTGLWDLGKYIYILADASDKYLSYKSGKEMGIWGLVNIFFTLVLIAGWKYIQPLFEKVGLVEFFDGMGLIREGSPGLTTIYIVMFCLLVIYSILFVYFVLISEFIGYVNMHYDFISEERNKIDSTTLLSISRIFIYPISLIITWISCFIFLPNLIIDTVNNMKERRKNPQSYKARKNEVKRLSKNRELLSYLIYLRPKLTPEEKAFFDYVDQINPEKSVILDVEEAAQRLNRLPIDGDHSFLIGISYDRETYLLVPRPRTPYTVQTPNTFLGEKWKFFTYHRLSHNYFGSKNLKPTFGIVWALTKFERECEYPKLPDRAGFNPEKHKMQEYDMDMFEFIIDPWKHYDIMSELKEYLNYCHYQYYIGEQQDLYFQNKKNLLEKMDKAESREEFMVYADELKEFNANNEDVAKMIWEGNQNNIKG